MTKNEIFENLNRIRNDFDEFILNKNFEIYEDEISWPNYKPGIYKMLYAKEYEQLVSKRQYSFILKRDSGFFQFYFKFDKLNEIMTKIKMAYYPYPVKLKNIKDNIEEYFNDSNDNTIQDYYYDIWNLLNIKHGQKISEPVLNLLKESSDQGNFDSLEDLISHLIDLKYEITNSSHIRIDYDFYVESHSKCEIQIGAINKIRFPLDRIVMPYTFFDFIIKNIAEKESYEIVSATQNFIRNFGYSKSKSNSITGFNESNIYLTIK